MIFLSSLAAYIKDIKAPPLAVLEKFNDIMMLSSNPNALMFPIEIKSKIWANLKPEDFEKLRGGCNTFADLEVKRLNPVEKRIISSAIINKAPKCLLYSSFINIRKDIYRMFDNMDYALAV